MKKPKGNKQTKIINWVTNCLQPVKVKSKGLLQEVNAKPIVFTQIYLRSVPNKTVTPLSANSATLCKGETTLAGGYCSHYQLTLLKTETMAMQTVGTTSLKRAESQNLGVNRKHSSVVTVSTICISTARFVTFFTSSVSGVIFFFFLIHASFVTCD